MDYRLFDSVRRQASPVEVDLVEAFAQGRISRRAFVARGSMIGLGAPLIAAILAACGSDSKSSTPAGGSTAPGGTTGGTTAPGGTTAAGPIKQGGTLRIAAQKPAGPLDPVKMADLGTYTPVVTAFEYLVDILGAEVKPMLAEKWSPNADGSVGRPGKPRRLNARQQHRQHQQHQSLQPLWLQRLYSPPHQP